jgi:hypothetical protein
MFAFAAPAALPVTGGLARVMPAVSPLSAPAAPAVGVVTMRCRRDLKKEKSLRNMEYARQHRKKVPSRYNRRSEQQAISNTDVEYLSSIYGTLQFEQQQQEQGYGGGRR